ncbi:BPTD_2524 family lipoprotein [Achromobacter spanius]|uniref:Lipoprotein n=1 Tax=Achromobacter spanius TaxID=217203 RepID=A0AAW3HW23_9BURK|nr:hypothetical protein [Achromobacter spanius]KNE23861.1 hypothetical protein AFM18_26435 [Achromobacter spanius]
MRKLLLCTATVALTGCAFGISNDGTDPTQTFEVATPYQETYRRADAYPRHCLQLPDQIVTGNLYHDTKSGVIRVNSPASGKPLEVIEIKELAGGTSQVTITVWGIGIWDEGELQAARKSLETGENTCRSPSYRRYQ